LELVPSIELQLALLLPLFGALFISSVAGYGGSLIVVPVLVAAVGPREGIALAAVLLASNNVFKVIAYRRTLAARRQWRFVVVAVGGVAIGSLILVTVPQDLLVALVIASALGALLLETVGQTGITRWQTRMAHPLMFVSGVLSGSSGMSGPLKGVAVRSLNLPRLEQVGLLSFVSLAGDLVKVGVFAGAEYLAAGPVFLALAIPVMPLAAWTGRWVNERIDEGAFRAVFWAVVGGYLLRGLGVWF
jgi:uncharacterized membrane protein YfcA